MLTNLHDFPPRRFALTAPGKYPSRTSLNGQRMKFLQVWGSVVVMDNGSLEDQKHKFRIMHALLSWSLILANEFV
jgi:hypothetical protein